MDTEVCVVPYQGLAVMNSSFSEQGGYYNILTLEDWVQYCVTRRVARRRAPPTRQRGHLLEQRDEGIVGASEERATRTLAGLRPRASATPTISSRSDLGWVC